MRFIRCDYATEVKFFNKNVTLVFNGEFEIFINQKLYKKYSGKVDIGYFKNDLLIIIKNYNKKEKLKIILNEF